MRVQKKREEAA
jgi:hypothetical protein